MHLFYIDESGTGLNDTHSPYFILAAVAVPQAEVQQVDLAITALKNGLFDFAKPEDFELKGVDLRQGHKFFKRLSWNERLQIMQKVSALLDELPIKVIATRVDTRDLPQHINSDMDLYRLAFWQLLKEIDVQLSNQSEYGIILIDTHSTGHSSLQDRRIIDAFLAWGKKRTTPTRLIERPLFGFSAFYPCLQLADFAAYMIALASKFEAENSESTTVSDKRSNDLAQIAQTILNGSHIVDVP